ncbi:MAG: hypothetical protein HQK75_06990 [Candidatus Magnetomorum sp.]|nr:hypothetical protein [Candidatus Magnetomorum sp.]
MKVLSSKYVAGVVIIAILICVGQVIWLSLERQAYQKDIAVYQTIIQSFLPKTTDVDALMDIHSPQDIQTKRHELINKIWGQSSLPSTIPYSIEKDILDTRYQSIKEIKTIHRLTVRMDYGLNSIVYIFMPHHPTSTIVMYHQGHEGDFISGQKIIQRLLMEGYAVAGFSMPLLGMNNQPIVYLNRFGKFRLTDHDHFKMLLPEKGHPVQYFLTPVIEVINTAEVLGFTNIAMLGISGGGWTSTLIAALDPRILRSYPVAGTLPIYLRSDNPTNWGDYEQTIPEIYRIANYLELYIMGAFGFNRKQMQILNAHDPCCFNGTTYQTYYQPLKTRVQHLQKGTFEIFSDNTNLTHSISPLAIDLIVNDLHTAF